MNSLPFISHHLFVAAVASDERDRSATESQTKAAHGRRVEPARAVPLEVLVEAKAMAGAATRRFRTMRAVNGI
jgi:hypothetical protein